ncbi:MAG: glycosyltransferase family 4 protein [Promethearchaeota archaeon]
MHILIIQHRSGLDVPLRSQLAEIFGEYLSKKHKISVITFSDKNRDYMWKGCYIYEIKFKKNSLKYCFFFPFLLFIKKIRKIISDEKIDLVFGRNVYIISNLFYPISKILKVPFVLQLTVPVPIGHVIESSYLKSKLLLFILKITMNMSDLLLLNYSLGRYIEKLWRVDKTRIFTLHNGVNVKKFNLQFSKLYIKKKYLLIYVGTLDLRRKLEILIKAMGIVVNKFPTANLLIVGDGTGRESLMNLTKKLNLTNNIKFIGRVSYSLIPRYLNSSYIGVCPVPPTIYYKLSSPLKLLEYMGAGLAIVANEEIIEHKKILEETNGGKLFSFEKEENLANAIIDLLSQKEKLKEMGERNIRWVHTYRDYKHLANNLEKKLLYVLKNYKN